MPIHEKTVRGAYILTLRAVEFAEDGLLRFLEVWLGILEIQLANIDLVGTVVGAFIVVQQQHIVALLDCPLSHARAGKVGVQFRFDVTLRRVGGLSSELGRL